MEEEKSRHRHKEAILRLKEKAILEKAKKQIEALEALKTKMVDDDKNEDRMPEIRRKQKSILSRLKEKQAEIARMRENLSFAERERRFLVKQQKSFLKGRSSRPSSSRDSQHQVGVEMSEPFAAAVAGPETADSDAKIEKSLAKVEKKGGGRQSSRERQSRQRRRSSDEVAADGTKATPSNLDSQPPLGSSSGGLRGSPVLQREALHPVSTGSVYRLRHSSAESEPDNLSISLNDSTLSDQSDIEARVSALNEQLQARIKTAARLKKQHRRDMREKLRGQEQTLLKQIEVYDQLIKAGSADRVEAGERFTRPIIKSPKSVSSSSGTHERLSTSFSREPVTMPPPATCLPPENTEPADGIAAEDLVAKSVSSTTETDEIATDSNVLTAKDSSVDDSESSNMRSHLSSTSTVLASPTKPDAATPLLSEEKQSHQILQSSEPGRPQTPTTTESEVIEEALQSFLDCTLHSTEESLPEQSPSKGVIRASSPLNGLTVASSPSHDQTKAISSQSDPKLDSLGQASPEQPDSQATDETSNNMEPSVKESAGKGLQGLMPRQFEADMVERLTEQLWSELLADTTFKASTTLKSSTTFKATDNLQSRGQDEARPTTPTEIQSTIQVSSPTRRSGSTPALSPRSKPQDLMLTTFDISSSSSSENSSPVDLRDPGVGNDAVTNEVDRDDDVIVESPPPADQEDGQYFEDDFGLSAIRQEAESLRLQQLKVEQEIARIQSQEASSQIIRHIPDKPPPPYTPPARPPRPVPPKIFIPNTIERMSRIIDQSLASLYSAKLRGESLAEVRVELTSTLVEEEPEELEEDEAAALGLFQRMLVDLTREKMEALYKNENVQQNPLWMSPLPVNKLKFLVPKTFEDLSRRVKKQVKKIS